MVAICQGCTGQNIDPPITTTAKSTTQTTTPKSTTQTTTPKSTSEGPITMTTVKTTTTTPDQNCCPKITVTSQGGVLEHYGEALGDYVLEATDDQFVYQHKTNLISIYLHHTIDEDHNWSGWQFTRDVSDVFGFIANENEDTCPSGICMM